MRGEGVKGVRRIFLLQLYFSGGFPTAWHGRVTVAPLDTFTDPTNKTITGLAENEVHKMIKTQILKLLYEDCDPV